MVGDTNKVIDLYMNSENKGGFIPKGFEMIYPRYDACFDVLIPVAKKCIADLGKLNEGKKSRSATLDANAMAGRILGSALDIEKLYNSVLDAIIFINKHKTS